MKNYSYLALIASILVSPLSGIDSSNWFAHIQETLAATCKTIPLITNFAKVAAISWWDTQKPYEIIIKEKTPETLALLFNKQNQTKDFLLGASTSEHQSSQQCSPSNCSYSRFTYEQKLLQPTAENGYSMDWWNNYKNYIDYAKRTLNLNALRFSVEWALVQPERSTTWSISALDHYANVFKYMIKQNITPVVCFHHYTDPCWFIDQGGFEEEKNLVFFKKFCVKIYTHIMQSIASDPDALQALKNLNNRPPLWATYNSPEGYAFKIYHLGELPQAQTNNLKKGIGWACHVLNNMMQAHVLVYDALHKAHVQFIAQEMHAPMVGFLKNIHQLDPAEKTLKQQQDAWKSRIICGVGNHVQNDIIYNFFAQQLSKKLDFIGLNYYSNSYMHGATKMLETDPELKTNNKNYRIYPQGLYRALTEISDRIAQSLNIPIYVTENGIGIADTQAQWKKRNTFYQHYLYALYYAIKKGINVRGYLTWTLANNYEWQKPGQAAVQAIDKRIYGLCNLINDGKHIELKDQNNYYIAFAKLFHGNKNI